MKSDERVIQLAEPSSDTVIGDKAELLVISCLLSGLIALQAVMSGKLNHEEL